MSEVIIINGPSCAGKSTIAKEICRLSDFGFVHVQVDEAKKYLFTILDSKSTPSQIGRPICDEILLRTAQIFLANRKDVIIDTTFDGNDGDQIAKRHIEFFKNTKPLVVGIDCALEERLRRFRESNNNPVRNAETIIAQSNVFELCKKYYDLWFDSSLMTASNIATEILRITQT